VALKVVKGLTRTVGGTSSVVGPSSVIGKVGGGLANGKCGRAWLLRVGFT
jgi:hypothetical protein